MKTVNTLITCIAIQLLLINIIYAQNQDKDSGLFGYNYYNTQRMDADSLEKILLKRIPQGLEVRDCILSNLTRHHWVHNWSPLFRKGYVICTFYENGEMTVDLNTGNAPHITKGYYYLSESPDFQFDTTKIGNTSGRFLITGKKNDINSSSISKIVKCTDESLIQILGNQFLTIYSYKPLKEPYEDVIKNGYLTVPFEDYGFIQWK